VRPVRDLPARCTLGLVMPWLRHLAVLFAFLAAFVRPAPASAFTSASPETRVGGFEVAAHLLAGEHGAASREQHQGIGAAYDQNASGYRFAAGGGLGKSISEGHAFGKHVLKKGEFKDLGITTREGFAKHIDDVVGRAKGADVRQLSGGRSAYWDEASGTVVIRNPSASDMGTAFRPTAGRTYFETLK